MSSPEAYRGEDPPQTTIEIPPPELPEISRRPVAASSASTSNTSKTIKEDGDVTTNADSLEEAKLADLEARALLIKKKDPRSAGTQKLVSWGVPWRTPSLIVLWAFIGFSLALGHHYYYLSLDGTKPGSPTRQSWPVLFGTAFAFLIIASLRAACDISYKQYIWTLFKRKSFSLDTLDKLFSVTFDPTAFFSWDFIKHAKIAFLVAILCWCMPLAGVIPPATLSIVPGFNNASHPVSMSTLAWDSNKFVDYGGSIAQPTSEVLQITTLSAQTMAIIPPTPPAPNSSFHIAFNGPTLRCNPASGPQQQYLDLYAQELANRSPLTATRGLFETNQLKWRGDGPLSVGAPVMNVYSAFSPYAGLQGGLIASAIDSNIPDLYAPDAYNNWALDLPFDTEALNVSTPGDSSVPVTAQQLWIQTSDEALICAMGIASFDVQFEFVNAALTMAECSVSLFEPFKMPLYGSPMLGGDVSDLVSSYKAVYLAISSLFNGNVSTSLNRTPKIDMEGVAASQIQGLVTMYDGSSKIIQCGLSACDEIAHSYWNGDNAIGPGEDGPVPWRQAGVELTASSFCSYEENRTALHWSFSNQSFASVTNNLFTKPAWMCRNRTLLRAIEDLANNVTISMLSSANLVTPNATTVNVTTFPIHNIYRYESRNLILSYSIAIILTLSCACIGFFALSFNGVAHSTTFSAIIAATRNGELDEVSKGHSLGALPTGNSEMRLRFGVLLGDKGREGGRWHNSINEGGDGSQHIGFGAAERVLRLKRGGKYI